MGFVRKAPAALFIVIVLTLVLTLVLAIAWMWRPGVKGAPVSGGANFHVQLPDTVHFRQKDGRWAAHSLGGGQDNGSLGGYGCTVASVAIAMTNLGHPTDPGRLNADLTAKGGFTERGWLRWEAVGALTKGALRADVYDAPSLEAMDACLLHGGYPIVKFLIGGAFPHWVILVGKREGTYLVRDPLLDDAEPVPLSARASSVQSVRCVRQAGAVIRVGGAP